jgi:hypothetical protein
VVPGAGVPSGGVAAGCELEGVVMDVAHEAPAALALRERQLEAGGGADAAGTACFDQRSIGRARIASVSPQVLGVVKLPQLHDRGAVAMEDLRISWQDTPGGE